MSAGLAWARASGDEPTEQSEPPKKQLSPENEDEWSPSKTSTPKSSSRLAAVEEPVEDESSEEILRGNGDDENQDDNQDLFGNTAEMTNYQKDIMAYIATPADLSFLNDPNASRQA